MNVLSKFTGETVQAFREVAHKWRAAERVVEIMPVLPPTAEVPIEVCEWGGRGPIRSRSLSFDELRLSVAELVVIEIRKAYGD